MNSRDENSTSGSPSNNRILSAKRSESPVSRERNGSRKMSYKSSRDHDRSRYRSKSRSPRRYKNRYSHSKSRSYSPRGGRYERKRSHSRSPLSGRRRHVGSREHPQQSRCLGVFGLSIYTTEQQINQIFTRYGPVERVQVVIDAKTGRSRGFCFVYFASAEDAKVAKEQCSGMEIDDRRIRVDYSITQRAHTPTPGVYMGKPTRSHRDRDSDRSDRYKDDDYHERDRHRYRDRSPSPHYRDRRRRYDKSRSRSYSPRERAYEARGIG